MLSGGIVPIDRDTVGGDWREAARRIRGALHGREATLSILASMTAADSTFSEQVSAAGFSFIPTKPAKTSQLLNTPLASAGGRDRAAEIDAPARAGREGGPVRTMCAAGGIAAVGREARRALAEVDLDGLPQ